MNHFMPPGECPVCGCTVPAKAKACPECGASAEAGWNEESLYDGLDLPPATEETDKKREDGPERPRFLPITITVILLLILSGIWFLF